MRWERICIRQVLLHRLNQPYNLQHLRHRQWQPSIPKYFPRTMQQPVVIPTILLIISTAHSVPGSRGPWLWLVVPMAIHRSFPVSFSLITSPSNLILTSFQLQHVLTMDLVRLAHLIIVRVPRIQQVCNRISRLVSIRTRGKERTMIERQLLSVQIQRRTCRRCPAMVVVHTFGIHRSCRNSDGMLCPLRCICVCVCVSSCCSHL